METQDATETKPEAVEPSRLKTLDLGIEGLAPAVHLGSGGSANVFAAKRLETGDTVAVKLLRASADSAKERVRFEREQETLQRLTEHDGIVPVLDAGLTDREEPYFFMPLMEGSLQDRIDRDGALDWQTATQLVAQVADTVAFAHEQQVLHRDLKPGNILLDEMGIPRVADFGIAKLMDSSVSKSSKSLGTPSFMPPERFNGLEATQETDVYGLGATLAALITGSAPFLTGHNDTDAAVMLRVVTEQPPSLEEYDLPEEVRFAVQQAMAKDPVDRPATVAAFAEQLRAAIDPHVDPAMTGPVTVAIAHRNITIPDGPVTPSGGTTITIEEEEDDRRKLPLWLMSAAAVLLAVVGAFGLSALFSGPGEVVAGPETAVLGVQADVSDGAVADDDTATPDGQSAAGQGDNSATTPIDDESADGYEDGVAEGETETDDASTGAEGGDTEDVSSASGTDTGTTDGGTTDTGTTNTGGTNTGTTNTGGTNTGTTDTGSTGTNTGGTNTGTNTGSTNTGTTPPAAAKPVACFASSASKVETGHSVTFTNCSTDATSYAWDLAGTSSSSTNASASWTSAGTKSIRLTATGPGGSHTATKTVTVSETPPPPVRPSACFNASPSTVEIGQSVTLSNCSTDATSYSWSFGDNTSSSSTNASKSWSTAGSKTVRLTAEGPGGSHSTTKTITVNAPVAKADACFTPSATTIDAGQSVKFTNCSTDATSYWWEFGNGATSSEPSPNYTFSTAGSFTVKLTARGDGGDDTATRTITVNAKVTPAFTDRVEIGSINDDNVRIRFTTNVSAGYTLTIKSGGSTVKTQSGTATANQQTNATAGGLTPGTDYSLTVTLNSSPSVSSSAEVRTSGSTEPPPTTPVQLLNLRTVDVGSTYFEFKYESNICANGSFTISVKYGGGLPGNAGQSNGCTNTHLGIPGRWTGALTPGTTYVVTVTVEANGQGKGGGNTASRTIEVTTAGA